MYTTHKRSILVIGLCGVLLLPLISEKQAFAQGSIPAPGFQPSGMAYDGAVLFVSDLAGFRTIFKLNPATGDVMGSFLAPSPGGFDGRSNPNDLASDGNGRLFVVDIGGNPGTSGIVYEIDSGGTTVFNSFLVPFRGGAIAFDGVNLYVSDFDGDKILVTNRSGIPIRAFSSGLRPAGMVFDPVSKLIWVISEFDRKISQITTDGRLVRSCDGPRDPGIQGMGGVTMVGSQLYIAEVSDPDPFSPPNVPGTIFIRDPRTLECSPPFVLPVSIDIKPGSFPNSINRMSKGNVPVALLSSATFDATRVDRSTISFAGATALSIGSTPQDVNGDGLLDVVLHFDTSGLNLPEGTTEACLTGSTIKGTPFRGCDSVRLVR